MTVPGKGGRQRKWRSDADRKRAYVARRRGEPEPEQLLEALANGDELAHAWELIRQLGVELAAARANADRLRQELRAAARELKAKDQRFAWLESLNTELTAAVEGARRGPAAGTAEPSPPTALATTQARFPIVVPAPRVSDAPSMSRAERRRLERERRKRW